MMVARRPSWCLYLILLDGRARGCKVVRWNSRVLRGWSLGNLRPLGIGRIFFGYSGSDRNSWFCGGAHVEWGESRCVHFLESTLGILYTRHLTLGASSSNARFATTSE